MSRSTCSLLVLALAGLLLLATVSGCDDAHRRRKLAEDCRPSGMLRPSESHSCEDCCKAGESYEMYVCSPPVASSGSGCTRAIMTLNDFDEGGDGGDPSECDGEYHENTERVVALSTGWYSGAPAATATYGSTPTAGPCSPIEVAHECDSMNGCDREHAYQPPCRYECVSMNASQLVWDALGITGDEVGEYDITWSDAWGSGRWRALCTTDE